jgi:ubiquinone/menaquinone biosynthesis C-methylase UbiE
MSNTKIGAVNADASAENSAHSSGTPPALPSALKSQVRDFWNENPCGAKFTTDVEFGSRDFFDRVEAHRYETEWHIRDVAQFDRWHGHDVLEIGCGLGTDAVQFARAGARYTGVDLTPRAVEIVRRRFELYGLEGTTRVADAENLPFEDDSFDVVYSHGVLHHTPDTQRAFDEIYRVLRPGGRAMVMLYHRGSYNYHVNIMTLRRFGAHMLRFAQGPAIVSKVTGEDRERLEYLRQKMLADPKRFFSTEEFLNHNTDGAGNPLAKVYTRQQAARMFWQFAYVRTEVHFLNRRWLPVPGFLLPRSVEGVLARRVGWHLWIFATK